MWSCAVRPKQNYVAAGSNDGTITYYQLLFTTVHGLYEVILFTTAKTKFFRIVMHIEIL
jgi:hypothetical protein